MFAARGQSHDQHDLDSDKPPPPGSIQTVEYPVDLLSTQQSRYPSGCHENVEAHE